MMELKDKRYSISEVAEITGVSLHLLRQWEERFSPLLHPRRTRTNQRYYVLKDIEIIRRIKYLIRQEGMTSEGARTQLAKELRGEGRPRSDREAIELLHQIEAEIQEMLDLIENG